MWLNCFALCLKTKMLTFMESEQGNLISNNWFYKFKTQKYDFLHKPLKPDIFCSNSSKQLIILKRNLQKSGLYAFKHKIRHFIHSNPQNPTLLFASPKIRHFIWSNPPNSNFQTLQNPKNLIFCTLISQNPNFPITPTNNDSPTSLKIEKNQLATGEWRNFFSSLHCTEFQNALTSL